MRWRVVQGKRLKAGYDQHYLQALKIHRWLEYCLLVKINVELFDSRYLTDYQALRYQAAAAGRHHRVADVDTLRLWNLLKNQRAVGTSGCQTRGTRDLYDTIDPAARVDKQLHLGPAGMDFSYATHQTAPAGDNRHSSFQTFLLPSIDDRVCHVRIGIPTDNFTLDRATYINDVTTDVTTEKRTCGDEVEKIAELSVLRLDLFLTDGLCSQVIGDILEFVQLSLQLPGIADRREGVANALYNTGQRTLDRAGHQGKQIFSQCELARFVESKDKDDQAK